LGTLKVSLVAILVAGPLGVLSAIFVFYLPRKWSRTLGSILELSSSFPSVAIALFAFVVLSPALQTTLHTTHRLNALLAGIAVSLAIVPIVCTLSLQALSAVPPSLTDAALALGSTRAYALVHVVFRSAFAGIVASIILAFSRAMGETVIVLLVAGNGANNAASFGVTTRTVSGALALELPGAASVLHVRVLFLLALLLVLFSILANHLATRILEWPKTRSMERP
jgi:phosphate transport system permease protein